MKQSLRYILYSMLCIVSLIIVFIFFWWFTGKYYTKENFATPMPYIVLVGLTTTGDVYYADVDVPMNPKWVKTHSGIGDIAGAYGQLYTVATGGSVPKYGPYDSTTQTSMAGGTVTKISVDDMNTVVGLNGQDYRYSSTLTGTLAAVPGQMKSVSINAGVAYWVGSDGTLQFCSAPATNTWITTKNTAEWKEVSFDSGVVCALKTAGGVWTADKNVRNNSVNFIQQGTKNFNQICIKAGRLVGVGTDGKPYYSDSYSSPSWTELPTKTYTAVGAPTTPTSLSFSKVIMMYPRLDARRRRFRGTATTCNSNEEVIGDYCYQNCPSGRKAKGTFCPYRAKHVNATATCPAGFEYVNGGCYAACPGGAVDPKNPEMCLGAAVTKMTHPAAAITPAEYVCPPNGVAQGRYIRVRPSRLIQNNKLCIQRIIVKDNLDNIISNKIVDTTSGSGSSLGRKEVFCYGTNGGYTAATAATACQSVGAQLATYPQLAIAYANGADWWRSGWTASSTTAAYYPINMILETAGRPATKGIYSTDIGSNPSAVCYGVKPASGTANVFPFNPNFWNDPNREKAGWTPSASATDAFNSSKVECPIGGPGCEEYDTYISGGKYDRDADGGQQNRITNTYWDLDLGGVMNIKKIIFTGCAYVAADNTTTTTAAGTPGADQITGMTIEILQNSNLPSTPPITSRSLGPEITQELEFNFRDMLAKACYSPTCPTINGLVSIKDELQKTCTVAQGGITSRSVTTPLDVGAPVYGPPTDARGNPLLLPGNSVTGAPMTYRNWVQDPNDPSYILSCDGLPGSVMKPLSTTFNAPTPNTGIINENDREAIIRDTPQPNMLPASGAKNTELGTPTTVFSNSIDPSFSSQKTKLYQCHGTSGQTRDTTQCNNPVTSTFTTSTTSTAISTSGSAGSNGYSSPSGQVCVVESDSLCQTNYTYSSNLNSCVMNSTYKKRFYRKGNCNGCRQVYAGVHSVNVGWDGTCWVQYGSGGVWHTKGYMDQVISSFHNTESTPTTISVFGGLKDDYLRCINEFRDGVELVARDTYLSLNMAQRIYSNPVGVESVNISKPKRIRATLKCLNPDGSANQNAFMYGGRCMKCPSKTDVFYPKGITGNTTWSNEHTQKALVPNTGQNAYTNIYGTQIFYKLNDAKAACESIAYDGTNAANDCRGVSGIPGSYTLRAGVNLSQTSATSGDPLNTSSWRVTVNGAATLAPPALNAGSPLSSAAIPRAFADDYVGSAAASTTSKAAGSSLTQTISTYSAAVDSIYKTMSSIAAAAASALYISSIQNSNQYYTIVGTERHLNTTAATTTEAQGVCIGPCDSEHPLHDPVALYKDNRVTVLYGTTCHNASEETIDLPNVPAMYIPQKGNSCPDVPQANGPNKVYEFTGGSFTGGSSVGGAFTGGSCVEECAYGTNDSGSQCVTTSTPRTSSVPTYSCGNYNGKKLQLVDTVCLYPCENGHVLNGEYCEPPQLMSTFTAASGSTGIRCTKTGYGYSGSQGSGRSKWLCDSPEDMKALLNGVTTASGLSSYVDQNDIVCTADDPTTGMYYCQSVDDATNNREDTVRPNIQSTCDGLVKAYYDLSNNLDILASANTSAQNATGKLQSIFTTLQGVYSSICPANRGSSTLCTSLNSQLVALNTNMNAGSGTTTGIMTPIQAAMASRDVLVAQMRKFQCSF